MLTQTSPTLRQTQARIDENDYDYYFSVRFSVEGEIRERRIYYFCDLEVCFFDLNESFFFCNELDPKNTIKKREPTHDYAFPLYLDVITYNKGGCRIDWEGYAPDVSDKVLDEIFCLTPIDSDGSKRLWGMSITKFLDLKELVDINLGIYIKE